MVSITGTMNLAYLFANTYNVNLATVSVTRIVSGMLTDFFNVINTAVSTISPHRLYFQSNSLISLRY